MSPTPNLQDLLDAVRESVPNTDPLAQLAKAAEIAADLGNLGDRLQDHFVFKCREAGLSWSELSGALGVSKQAAHKRFNGGLAPTFQRLTQRAHAVVQGATDLAREFGHKNIGTEHLLLALYVESARDGVAGRALTQLGIEREALQSALLKGNPKGEGPTIGAIPFTGDAKESLKGALDEAIGLGHNYIGTEHLLLGLDSDAGYTSRQILEALGADPERLRTKVMEVLKEMMRELNKG